MGDRGVGRRGRITLLALAVASAAALFFARERLIDVRPGGAFVADYAAPSLAGLFLLSAILAASLPSSGGTLGIGVLAVFTAVAAGRIETWSVAIVLAVFGGQAVAWIAADIRRRTDPHGPEMTRRHALGTLAGAVVALTGGTIVGRYVDRRLWGPTHPASAADRLPSSPVDWVWCGAVTATSCAVRARPGDAQDLAGARLLVATDPGLSGAEQVAVADVFDRVLDFRPASLVPDTTYHYALEIDGEIDRVRTGTFRTFPDRPRSARLAFGGCARIGSNGAVFDEIRRLEPDVFVCLGDFHYGDNFVDDVDDYRQVFDVQLTQPGQSALYRSTPFAYVWDDHDYGPNDSNRDAPGRPAAMKAYREYVPHYELAGPDSAIYQGFSLGSVRVLLTDARSARTPQSLPDDAEKSMLGIEQREWLLDELAESAPTHDLVIWVNPVPWVAERRAGGDSWSGYTTERRLIADHIADNGIDNLLMVSGDAHMVAIDDGTHTNYSSAPGPGFPLIHAAALDRPGSAKGGPFTHGPIGGGGQFAVVDVEVDDGTATAVSLRAVDWRGETLLAHRYPTT